jgi:hypothetical protein
MVKRSLDLLIDGHKLWLAQALLKAAELPIIRTRSLSNLQRWKDKGTWGAVYDEWWVINDKRQRQISYRYHDRGV